MDGDYASVVYVQFLFGIFCAFWAQTTNRSWLVWLLLGLFFAPLTGLFLLAKNGEAMKAKRAA
jgi:hypothetical protein